MTEESNVENYKPKKRILNWKKLICIIGVFLLIISFISIKFVIANIRYTDALLAYGDGKYEEAIATFSSLGDYINSKDMVLAAKYSIAILSYNDGNYDLAISIFEELEGYKSSDEMIKRSIYHRAIDYAEKEYWDSAINTISKIPDFNDSNDLLLEYKYAFGLEKMAEKDWNSAIDIFNTIPSYKDSSNLTKKCTLNLAQEKAYKFDWKSAIDILDTIPNYGISDELKRQYKINIALKIRPTISKEIIIPTNPTSVEDFEIVLLYMLRSKVYDYEILYNVNHDQSYIENELSKNFLKAKNIINTKIPEHGQHFNNTYISFYDEGNTLFVINLSSWHFDNNNILRMDDSFRDESYNIIEGLIEEDRLTASMTEKEKAEVLYKWMAYNIEYDHSFSCDSFTGYGAAINRKALCGGYTALYNMLCSIVGIKVEGVVGMSNIDTDDPGLHMWTLANLDGEMLYIDSTWGDGGNYVNMDYFAVTKEFLSKTHEFED